MQRVRAQVGLLLLLYGVLLATMLGGMLVEVWCGVVWKL